MALTPSQPRPPDIAEVAGTGWFRSDATPVCGGLAVSAHPSRPLTQRLSPSRSTKFAWWETAFVPETSACCGPSGCLESGGSGFTGTDFGNSTRPILALDSRVRGKAGCSPSEFRGATEQPGFSRARWREPQHSLDQPTLPDVAGTGWFRSDATPVCGGLAVSAHPSRPLTQRLSPSRSTKFAWWETTFVPGTSDCCGPSGARESGGSGFTGSDSGIFTRPILALDSRVRGKAGCSPSEFRGATEQPGFSRAR